MKTCSLSLLVLLAGLVTSAGCARDQTDSPRADDDESSIGDPAPAEVSSRTLLSEVRLSPTHVISFYELQDGGGLVEETLDVDLDKGPALPTGDARLTLAEVYRHVTGGADAPAEVQAADERTAKLPVNLPPIDDDASAPPLFLEEDGTESLVAPPPATCTSYNWALDKPWFLNNYCTEGTHHDCVVDWTAIDSWVMDTSFFKVFAFNQSLDATAHFWGGHQHCWTEVPFPDFWNWTDKCEWTTDFNLTVLPRKVTGQYWTGNGRRYAHLVGAQPCAHVGMAQMWNVPSDPPVGGGYVDPNPAGPCNYLGEVCCWNGTTSVTYCNSDYDYQLVCKGGYCGH